MKSTPSESTITRTAAARILGVTKSQVRRLEAAGRLHPTIEEGTAVRRFDPADVEALRVELARRRARRRAPVRRAAREELLAIQERGRLTARVFACFARGLSVQQTCIEAEVPDDFARELRRQWETDWKTGERQRVEAKARAAEERAAAAHQRAEREQARLRASVERARLLGAARTSPASDGLPPLPPIEPVRRSPASRG